MVPKTSYLKMFMVVFFYLMPGPGFSQSTTEPGFVLAPLVVRLAGVGAFYGPVIGMQNISSSTLDVIGGKTAGRIEATGLLIAQVPLSKNIVSLSAGLVQVDKMFLDVSYTRGMAEDQPVTQVGKAQGVALIFHWDVFKPVLTFNSTLASWDFKFDKYLTHKSEETIPLPEIHLGDLKSTFIINDLVFDITNSPEQPTSGFRIGINLSSLTTNTQFSGTNTASYYLNAYLPVGEKHTWVFRGFGSDTAVSQQKITDPEEIKSILAVDCNQVSNTSQKAECEQLRDNIANYLAAHNRYGTATPMGGNKMLRSYREMRFRGAHSRFLGTELRFNAPDSGFITNYQFALFYEKGTAVDDIHNLDQQYLASYGIAVRLQLNELFVRMEAARGEEGAEWFLTVGNPW